MTHETAEAIETAIASGEKTRAIAARFGVAPQDVCRVRDLGAAAWLGCGRPLGEILRERWQREAEAERAKQRRAYDDWWTRARNEAMR